MIQDVKDLACLVILIACLIGLLGMGFMKLYFNEKHTELMKRTQMIGTVLEEATKTLADKINSKKE